MTDHNIFYIPPTSIEGADISIKGAELRHIRSALRKRKGEHIILTDGIGHLYEAEITACGSAAISARVISKKHVDKRSKVDITLGFVPVKGLRNDTIIEKCTELGVARFVMFPSARSVVRDMGRQKIERLRKIAQSAMAQSRQCYLPEIRSVEKSSDVLAAVRNYDHAYVADPAGQVTIPATGRSVFVLVGPEGGFTDPEMEAFAAHGVKRMALGTTRLRSETAAIAAATKILVIYGQL